MSNRNRVDRVLYDPFRDIKKGPQTSQGINASFWNTLVDLGVDTTDGYHPRRPNRFAPANWFPDLKQWFLDTMEDNRLKQADKYDESQDH